MKGNNNLSNDNIVNKMIQLKKSQNNVNNNSTMNSLNRNSNGFPNTLPQNNPYNDGFNENSNELDTNSEILHDVSEEQSNFFENSALSVISKKINDTKDVDVTDFVTKLIKAKKIISIITASIPFVLPVIIIIIVVAVVMGQVMTVRDNINQLATKFTTGIEKFVNFAQGDGWMTNEESFFVYLNEQYEAFEELKSSGDSLDIPLIAATIHYSKQVDFGKYEELETDNDLEYEPDDFEQLGGTITKDKTASFYTIARDKLGSVSSIYPGQKRLLGHLSDVKLEPGFYDADSAAKYWEDFFTYALNIVNDTGMDIKDKSIFEYTANPFGALIKLYAELEAYLVQYEDITYGIRYDVANNIYELKEFMYKMDKVFETKDTGVQSDDTGIVFSIKVSTSMNYGYEEYQDKKQVILEMKAILREQVINLTNEDDIIEQAKNSPNSQLRSLYEKLEEINDEYMYSYTHYLHELYIPFTYFYDQEYTASQIDIIIDEIYDQRDFYNYLIGDTDDDMLNNTVCSGGCTYSVDGQEITNLKVRLMQCQDGTWGSPIPGEDLVDFEKYILGVVYAEIGSNPHVETAKVQAIAARNFALTRPKGMGNAAGVSLEKDGDSWILSIRNCTEDQVYCDPDKGCSNTTLPSNFGNSTTVYSGANTKQYTYKGPLPVDSVIRNAVSEVAGKVLLDKDEQLVSTSYTDVNQKNWAQQANSGMDYTEILFAEYQEARNISEGTCSNICSVTGDYAQWKQCGAPWSNIIIGDGKSICDIGCLATSVSIQLARSGVSLQNINGEFNPGSFVEAIKPNGFIYKDANGNIIPGGTLFVYDSTTSVAPNFKYQGGLHISLTGKTQSQKVAEIKKLINQGCYVVMEVKGNGGGQHWVAIDYVKDDTVYMMDPASTEVNVWKQYPHHWTSEAVCYKVTG